MYFVENSIIPILNFHTLAFAVGAELCFPADVTGLLLLLLLTDKF